MLSTTWLCLLVMLYMYWKLMLAVNNAEINCSAPPDTLKLQFAESGVPEALSEMIRGLQGGSDPHDLCSIKIASNLIVSLLLGGEWCSCNLVGHLWIFMCTPTSLSQYMDSYPYSLCVCVCVSDESMQKCFGEGSGLVYQDVLSWLQSANNQLQLSGALAIANFARNGEIFFRKEQKL